MKGFVCLAVLVVTCSLLVNNLYGEGQPGSSSDAEKPQPTMSYSGPSSGGDEGHFGVGVKVGLLGAGAEVAARVTHRSNVRAGFNVLGYSRNFSKDGVNYDGHLDFRTFEAHYDFFPWAGSFHVSPGLVAFVGDPIKARAFVPGSQSFTLGGQQYFSDPTAPTSATGKINFNNSVAPAITVGFGNLIHRDSKHFSVPVELGVAFQGSPQTTLAFTGNVCDAPGINCRPVASDATVQANVISEQGKINHSLSPIKVWPIISVGFGYKF